jgi:4-amino-4-deoxy-L-arabinose transferase-like glycosyltransferase
VNLAVPGVLRRRPGLPEAPPLPRTPPRSHEAEAAAAGAPRPGLLTRISALPPRVVVSALVLFALALFVNGFRHALTPDIHIDEMIYASTGQDVASGKGLTVQGMPFFWQPPLFFLVEAPLIKLVGLSNSGVMDVALQMRLLNAALGAATALGLFWLGWRLRGMWAGWAMALLYISDPFVIRVTRRLYLEPFAAMWVLFALWFCWSSSGRWTWKRRAIAGVLFGMALLSKELTFFALGVPVLLWLRREMSWKEPFAILLGAAATYGIYPIWSYAVGWGNQFLDLKRFQYGRLVGVFQYTGWNRPGVSFTQALLVNAADYWTSYLCILLAVPAMVVLWRRRDRQSRFLSSWMLVTFIFFAGLVKFGTLNDQFFYYLMIPTLACVAYVYSFNLPNMVRQARRAWRRGDAVNLVYNVNVGLVALVVGLLVIRPNAQVWTQRFAIERDDGMIQISSMLRNVVPARSAIDNPGFGTDILKFVFPGPNDYELVNEARPAVLATKDVHWYVMSDKDIWLKAGVDQHFYDLIRNNGTEVWGVSEHTFWHIGLWYVPYPERLAEAPAHLSVVTGTGLDARRS